MNQVVSPDKALDHKMKLIGEEYQQKLFSWQSLSVDMMRAFVSRLTEQAELLNLPSLAFAAKRFEHFFQFGISSVNVGGTMNSGKSSVAEALAKRLNFELTDADYFHPQENRDKQHRGEALTAEDRYPFLRDTQAWLAGEKHITTCSALIDHYRAIISGQDVNSIHSKDHPGAKEPWKIAKPNYGLLQIIISKPYELALEELDRSEKVGPQRMFDGKPHFIQVTRESEEVVVPGKTPLLRNQYNLIQNSKPMPWDVVSIDSSEMRNASGKYDTTHVIERLLKLPFVR